MVDDPHQIIFFQQGGVPCTISGVYYALEGTVSTILAKCCLSELEPLETFSYDFGTSEHLANKEQQYSDGPIENKPRTAQVGAISKAQK